jgi:hypothetical protein
MKFIFFLYLFVNLINSEKFIKNKNIVKNIDIPSCKSCIHYNPSPYDSDFTSTTSRCAKFGEKNLITEKIVMDFADSCRRDDTKCGKEGNYYFEESNLNLKIFKHKLITSIPNLLIVSILVFQLLAVYYHYIR